MNENNIFEERSEETEMSGKKPIHTASLVLGILSIVFGLLFALAGDVLSIIGIVLSVRNRKTHSTTAALICSIIGLVVSIGNHIVAVLMMASVLA